MEFDDFYKRTDTFSLGIMIPYLFIDFNLISKIKSSVFLTDLFNLFSRMCEPDYNKRIKPNECLELYYSLIIKYSSLKRKSSSSSKTKSKKKKKSKK